MLKEFKMTPDKNNMFKLTQTKLPSGHTKADRIEELKALRTDSPNTLIYIGKLINDLNGLTEDQYRACVEAWSDILDYRSVAIHGRCSSVLSRDGNSGIIGRPWKVNTKVGDNRCSVEVSAVVAGTHGDVSWGWHDDVDKIIVLYVSEVYQKRPISDEIIAQAEKEAQAICNERNPSKDKDF